MHTGSAPFTPTPYIVFGVILFILGIAGQMLSIPTLLPSLPVSLLCLVIGFWSRRPRTLLLIDVWLIAYFYLYLSEFMLSLDELLRLYSSTVMHLTESFVVASFGATLVGYGFLVRQFAFMPQKPSGRVLPDRHPTNQHQFVHHGKKTLITSRPVKGQIDLVLIREPIPFSLGLFSLFLALVCLYYITQVVTWQQLFYVGRSQRVLQVDVGLLQFSLNASLVVFPAVVVFLLRKYLVPLPLQLVLLLMVAIAIVAVFASGTRFLIGFQITGMVFLILPRLNLSLKQWFAIALVATLLLFGSEIMLTTRGRGVGIGLFAENLESLIQPTSYLSSEGNLSVNALIHLRKAYDSSDRVPENLFIFYWWVPRAWWPEKPTMAGYWVIRELSSQRGFSAAHSASGGFAMPALLDFGPVAGAFFSIVYGILIGGLEVYAWRNRDPRFPSAISAGLLYFTVFFMMRSLHTSLISLMTYVLVSHMPLSILLHLTRSRHQIKTNPIVSKPDARSLDHLSQQ